MPKKFRLFILNLCFVIPNFIQAQTVIPQVNGEVLALEVDEENQLLYVGGEFNRAGLLASYGAMLDEEGLVLTNSDIPNETVYTSIPDGSGGYYIGGDFSRVGEEFRSRLAHIDQAGNVTDFASDLNLNGRVLTLALEGSTLYFGGAFSTFGGTNSSGGFYNLTEETFRSEPIIEGQVFTSAPDGNGGLFIGGSFSYVNGLKRDNLAHVDASGELTEWAPGTNGTVNELSVFNGIVYVGGNFQFIGEEIRNYIASVDAETGEVTDWDPNADGRIESMYLDSDNQLLYLGGYFISIGQAARNRIAAIDINTGLANSWNPNANNAVLALTKDGNTIYAGGVFQSIGGQSRNRIASIETETGNSTSWNPNANDFVRDIIVDGDQVFVAGDFQTIGGFTRVGVASINKSTGFANDWNANVNSDVYELLMDGSTLYIGGRFSTVDGASQARIAALDSSDGSLLSFGFVVGDVYELAKPSSDVLFIGGTFSTIGGTTLNKLGAIDIQTGELTDWRPSVTGNINAIAVQNDVVYVGGSFSAIDDTDRSHIAALDGETGALLDWNPNSNGAVNVIQYANDVLYVGGFFTNIGGFGRNRAAALIPATGTANSWNPGYNGVVYTLLYEPTRNVVYVGGAFSSNLEAVDADTGTDTGWNPSNFHTGTVRSLSFKDGLVYAGGSYSRPNQFSIGSTYFNLKVLDDFTGNIVSSFDPSPTLDYSNGILYTISLDESSTFLGGSYDIMGGHARDNIFCFDLQTGEVTGWDPDANQEVHSIVVENDLVYVGGRFNYIADQSRSALVAIDRTTGLATDWNPDIEGINNGASYTAVIYDMFVNDSDLIIGGNFIAVGSDERRSLAAVDLSSGLASDWNPSPSESNSVTVYSMKFRNDTVYVGGRFSSIGGSGRNDLASILMVNGQATTWNPNVSGSDVRSLVLSDSLVYIGGDFTSVGGEFRQNIAALSIKTGLATSWDPDVEDEVFDLTFDGPEILIIGGLFEEVNSKPIEHIAALNLIDASVKSLDIDISGLYVNKLLFAEDDLWVGGFYRASASDVPVGLRSTSSPREAQIIQFDAIATKTYGDPSFPLLASSNTANDIIYSSSDSDIIEVNGDQAMIRNAGVATITAFQEGDADFQSASTSQAVAVSMLNIEVTAIDANKTYGDNDPILSYEFSIGGLVGDDQLAGAIIREDGEQVGVYEIQQNTLSSTDNYELAFVPGAFTIQERELFVNIDDQERIYGIENPELTYSLGGFAFNDDENSLTTLPVATTEADASTDAGEYSIQAIGGEADNYSFVSNDGTLTILKADQQITFDELPSGLRETDDDFTLSASTNSGLEVEFSSSDESIVSIDGTLAVILDGGEVELIASQPGNQNFNEAESISQVLSIEEVLGLLEDQNSRVEVYPNPAIDYFQLGETEDSEGAQINLIDANGKLQASYELKRGKKYSIRSLTPGIYLIIVRGDESNLLIGRLVVSN